MFQKSIKKTKVFVALSGGVDSAVAAAILKKQGYQVKGIFMKLNDLSRSREAEKKARKVAAILRIPFAVWDFRQEFQREVINKFLQEYQFGRTPNPCAVCNEKIKFGLFLKKSLALGADFMATGHYTKIKSQKSNLKNTNQKAKKSKTLYKLYTAVDKNKDQSYFLWWFHQKQLSRILFPLGDYTKLQVKKMARKCGLPVAEFSESQDICFIPATVNDFLSCQLKARPGKIVDETGKIIGEHPGIFYFTIGQRCGSYIKKTNGKSYFVAGKNFAKNILIAVPAEHRFLYQKQVELKRVNFLDASLRNRRRQQIFARVRYRQPLVKACLVFRAFAAKKYRLIFEQPQKFVAPGQAAVFYNTQGELLGGGILVSKTH